MAGLGFKDFQVGEVLTSADVDGYLMQQAVMRFADAAARGSALGTATGTAVPLAEGMVTYLDDLNRTEMYDGTSWTPISRILNVQQTVKTGTQTIASNTFQDVTDLSVTITPSSTTSKILLLASLQVACIDGSSVASINLLRGSTSVFTPDTPGSREVVWAAFTSANITNNGFHMWPYHFTYLDSPASASAQTYKIQVKHGLSATVAINRSITDNNAANNPRGVSTLTALEVPA